MAQHAGFRLNATYAPANNANAVDHGGVRIGTDQGVGIVKAVFVMHATRQVLQVDLVHDAKARWHNAKSVERLHAPLHELVALVIALKFQFHVQIECIFFAEVINLH